MPNPMTSQKFRDHVRYVALLAGCCSSLLTGCGVGNGNSNSTPGTVVLAGMSGTTYGGQQPIQGANIYLYAAGTTAYYSTNLNKLTTPVQSRADGSFTISNDYTCTAGQLLYIVAVGGNPGAGTNANEVTAAALGDCSTLSGSTFIQMNEVTTVGAAYALAPFATGYTAIGSLSTNAPGLRRAFVNATKLVNYATGTAPGVVATGATAPASEIYTLANILASCINTTGGTAGDSTNCGKLFTYTTPPGGTAPTDTFAAAINIARYPTRNVGSLFMLSAAQPPFGSNLNTQPNDWTVSILYSGGFSSPTSTTIDASGRVWVANSTNNTLSALAQTGTPISGSPFAGNGLNTPVAVAISSAGNVVVANEGASTVSAFTSTGGVASGSPYSVGNAPTSLAYDAAGQLWVTNSSGNSVTELNAAGATVQTITTGVTTPNYVVIDPK